MTTVAMSARLPAPTMKALQARAKSNQRSVSEEVCAILETALVDELQAPTPPEPFKATRATARIPHSDRPLVLDDQMRAVVARCKQPKLMTLSSRVTLRADQAPRDGKEKLRG